MNSKQRVAAAVARAPVDRVPLGLYAVDYDTIERVIGRPTVVRNQLAMQLTLWDGRRDELIATWKADLTDFYRRLDCVDIITCRDALLMPPPGSLVSPLMPPPHPFPPNRPPRRIGDNLWEDVQGRVFQAVPEVNEIKCVKEPAGAAGGEKPLRAEDFEGPVPSPPPPDPSVFAVLDHVIAEFGRDRYVLGPCGGGIGITLLGGFEAGLLLYATAPEVIEAAHRRMVIEQTLRDAHCVRPGQDGALFDQDMAGTQAPYISPEMFRRLSLPFMKERVAAVKRRVPRMFLHNCGCNLPLMDCFIEAGFDCYQSLQTTAGMELGLLKARYGDRMSFWGGVPLETLIGGTPAETRQAVRTALERGAPGSGFILGPSQSIAKGTRYENFMAMLDEFVRLRDRG
jgi:hypothetical protein